MQKSKIHIKVQKVLNFGLSFWILVFGFWTYLYAQEAKIEPIIVNGDTVEYSTDSKEFSATGNVEVNYKGVKLTCQKLILNTETKDADATGNARLEEKEGVVEGTKIIYNFNTQAGVIIDSEFRSNPYFGKAERTKKISDDEFIAHRGYFTTCNYDNPHYRIKSRKADFFPGDKIQTKDNIFYVGVAPLFYVPQYNHSLKDPLVHVQLMPGKSKEWGNYLLTAWRFSLAEDVRGRIYFDAREQLGVAEGFGINYTTSGYGKGDFKYYYTQERTKRLEEGTPAEFQRYLVRLRHIWDIDKRTKAILEYHKIVDSKMIIGGKPFLKEYSYREYEKDTEPLSYISAHHSFYYSSIDFLIQKRINRWYSQDEKLPEIKYSFPSIQMGNSPFYFDHNSSYLSHNRKTAVPSDSWNDLTYNRFDTTNKFSLPLKIAFFNLNPSLSGQQTFTDKNSTYGSTLQLNFSTGSELSTKFYRLFGVRTNFLGLNINDLRHVITPTISYSYTLNSAEPTREIRITRGTSIRSSSASLGLSNKLQTKRNGQKVDLADFRVNTTYTFNPKTGDKIGSNYSDILFDLELRPYSWMRMDMDVTYKHSGNDDDANTNYKKFSDMNYTINLDFAKERSVAFGQRYQRKGGNEITLSFDWRVSPKWKFSFYQRRNRGHSPALKRGLREQEYRLSRDLHCWTVDFTYNVRKGQGESLWLIFRLKAFPEVEFEYNQSYHVPKPGSQSNP